MKKKIINIVLLAATVAMTGCNDWLDMSPTNKVSEKIVWSDVNYVTQYVNGFYPYISRYGAFETGDSQVGLTDGLTETIKFGSATPHRRPLSISEHGMIPTLVSVASTSSFTD